MTIAILYNIHMNILMAFPLKGFLLAALLFIICFVGVHLLIFAYVGWETKRKKANKQPEEEKKPPTEREPIYYIVERKKKRTKSSYGEPKEINFKP